MLKKWLALTLSASSVLCYFFHSFIVHTISWTPAQEFVLCPVLTLDIIKEAALSLLDATPLQRAWREHPGLSALTSDDTGSSLLNFFPANALEYQHLLCSPFQFWPNLCS